MIYGHEACYIGHDVIGLGRLVIEGLARQRHLSQKKAARLGTIGPESSPREEIIETIASTILLN